MNEIIEHPYIKAKGYTDDFLLSPLVLEREASIPISYIGNFGSQDTLTEYMTVKKIIGELNNVKDQCVAGLEKEIKHAKGDHERKLFLKFKRNIFNNRKIDLSNSSNIPFLNLQVLESCLEYASLHKELNEREEKLTSIFNETKNLERRFLFNSYKNDIYSITKSLNFIQPNIFQKLDKYLHVDVDEHNAKLRKMDSTLAKVLTRAIMKTSPFSTLTYSKLKLKSTKNSQATQHIESRVSHTKVNETNLLRIFRVLTMEPEVCNKIAFKLIPTLNKEGDRFYWTTLIDQQEGDKKVFETRDRLVSMKITSITNEIHLTFNSQSFKKEELLKLVVGKGYNEHQADQLFFSLLSQRFIMPELSLRQNTDSLLEECIHKLSLFNSPKIKETSQDLTAILLKLENFDDKGLLEQQKIFHEISDVFDGITERLGLEKLDKSKILYQDAISGDIQYFSSNDWRVYEKSFHTLMEFINVFNAPYIMQLQIAADFRKVYGSKKVNTEDDWINLLQVLLDSLLSNLSILENQAQKDVKDYGNQAINHLNHLKNDFLDYMVKKLKENPVEIKLDMNYVASLISALPKTLKDKRQSNSFFFQKEEGRLILNHIYEGNLIYFARFLKYHPWLKNEEQLAKYMEDSIEKYNFHDVSATYGFNANSRLDVTGKSIKILNTPENTEGTKDNEQIDWLDTSFQYCDKTEELQIFHKGRKINIGFMGTLVPTLLPGVVSLMSMLSKDVALYTGIDKLLVSLSYELMQKENEKIKVIPEVTFDEKLVISRKKWIVDVEEWKDVFLGNELIIKDILDFSQEQGIPNKFFVYNYYTGDNFEKREKPQYIDLTSPTLLRLFAQLIRDNEVIIIEAAQPDYEPLNTRYVSEYILEFTKEGRL